MSIVEQHAAEERYGEAGWAEVETTIPARFEAMTSLHRSREALGSGSWKATYKELNAAANRLAQALLTRAGGKGATGEPAGGRGEPVALLMRHDGPLVAAALGVLKAGRIVVVLNPSDPPARLRAILEDAQPSVVVTDEGNRTLANEIAAGTGAVVVFDAQEGGAGTAGDPQVNAQPGDIAFLIYTSGSTGRPKAVMQSHRTILHNIRRLTRGMSITQADRLTLLASLSGGQGVATMWCALLNGAALCPFPTMEKGVTGLADWLGQCGITVYVSAASLFRHFMRTLGERTIPSVRLVRLGAEPATADDFALFARHFCHPCMLFNSLSSSETGNIVQWLVPRDATVAPGLLPVGYPPEGVELLLLDESGAEVRAGEAGQIVVRGRYLSPGYWRDQGQTAERFFEAAGGQRLFKSGDLARRGPDGALIFAGRSDARVKIRGYRIELSEIEAALERQPQVEKAIVCVYGGPAAQEEARLVAYLLLRAGCQCSAELLRQALRAILPGYMVPAGFVFVQAFPLTPHGKIDREKLLQMKDADAAPPAGDEPTTETEMLLAGIWRELFRRETVGSRDDFFALGGDSLIAAVVAARVHAAYGVQLDLPAFGDHPSLEDLAAAIDALRSGPGDADGQVITPASRDAPLPLSFAQERTWKYARTAESAGLAGNFTMATSLRITGPLDPARLQESISYLFGRHEILRSTFELAGGQPVQVIHPAGPVPLPLLDFSDGGGGGERDGGGAEPSAHADAQRRAADFFRQEARRPCDLARGPLLRFFLLRLGEEEHHLLRVNHHIISDAWSWKVFLRELAAVYEAREQGLAPPLPPTQPLQYADYAAWQRRTLAPGSAAYRATLKWWRTSFADNPRAAALPFRRLFRRRRAQPADGLLWWGLDPEMSQRLQALARREGATYYMIRLAAFAGLLAHATGNNDVFLGTYVTMRNRVEWQNMFGYFANLVTLRFRFDPAMTFGQWLALVKKTVGDAQAHSEIPYEQLAEELRKEGVKLPEVRAIFSVSDHTAPVRVGSLELTWLERRMEAMPWGFTLTFTQHQEETRCFAAFDARLYEPRRVREFIARYQRLLDGISRKPELSLARLLEG